MSSSSNNSNNSRGGRGGRGRGHGRVGGRDRGGRALQEKNWRDTRPTVPKVADEAEFPPLGATPSIAQVAHRMVAMSIGTHALDQLTLATGGDQQSGRAQHITNGQDFQNFKPTNRFEGHISYKKLSQKLQKELQRQYKATATGTTEKATFKDLPIEIRLQIWQYLAHEPRLIEMIYGPEHDTDPKHHGGIRVGPASRRTPAVLQVNSESRAEGMRYYTMRRINWVHRTGPDSWVYYQPDVDIFYFGNNCCLSTIFVMTLVQRGLEFPRIAIENTGRISMCCDLDDQGYGAGFGRDGGADLLGTLHGYAPSTNQSTPHDHFPGFHKLREIYFVVPSNLWPVESGRVDEFIGFRPAVHDGPTKGQQRFKRYNLEREEQVIEYGAPLGCGGRWSGGPANYDFVEKWNGADKPGFHFVSLAPKSSGYNARIYDGLPMFIANRHKLYRNGSGFIRDLEKTYDCTVVVPRNQRGEFQAELGFCGTKDAVAHAKFEVRQRLGDSFEGIVQIR